MTSDALERKWFSDPPSEFIRALVNELRMETFSTYHAAEIVNENQQIIVQGQNGTEINLIELILRSNKRTQELLDLAAKYSTVLDSRDKNEE